MPTPTTTKRLRRVRNLIAEHPEHFAMEYWLNTIEGYQPTDPDEINLVGGPDPSQWACGTTACIAGFAVATTALNTLVDVIERNENPYGHAAVEDVAADLLGLSYSLANAVFLGRMMLSSLEGVLHVLDEVAKLPEPVRRREYPPRSLCPDVPEREACTWQRWVDAQLDSYQDADQTQSV